MENETVLSLVSAEAVLAAVSCFCSLVSRLWTKVCLEGMSICIVAAVWEKNIYVLLAQEKGILQFGETDRVWTELTPPFLMKRLNKSKGHVTYCDFSLWEFTCIAKDSFRHVDIETGRRCRDPELYESAFTFATPFAFIFESKCEYLQAALLNSSLFFFFLN